MMNIRKGIIATLILLLSFGLTNFTYAGSGKDPVEKRLQRLEDIQAIKTLLIRYGRNLDSQNIEAYSKLFAEDGTWTGGMGSATGPAAIRKMVEDGIAQMKPGIFDHAFHIMSSMDIQVDGDTATAWSRWTWVIAGEDGKPHTERAGHYEDTLVRVNGEWKFKSRHAFSEVNN